MWILEHLHFETNDVTSTVLLSGPNISVGRKSECDIPFVDDKSVSRKHCDISIRNGKLFCIDTSTFGVHVNNQQLMKNVETEIKSGSLMKFGNENSSARISNVTYSFCPTRLSKSEKDNLKSFTKSIGATIAKDVDQCTHVICDKFSATMKTIAAIAMQKPIVLFDWIKSFADKKSPTCIIPPPNRYRHCNISMIS